MNRERAEHHGGNQRKGAVERKFLDAHGGASRNGEGVNMQASFRGQFAHGRWSPMQHGAQENAVAARTQGATRNNDADSVADSDPRRKFSAGSLLEYFIRPDFPTI